MKYFLDCEFIEDGKTIDLISIGIVAEDGREFYGLNWSCNFERASEWVHKNVLIGLPFRPLGQLHKPWYQKKDLGIAVTEFLGFELIPFSTRIELKEGESSPEIWGEWCSYDWVAFCQLFGTMMHLPKGMPMRCRDVIQFAEDHLGIPSSELPESLEVDGNHNALLGARTVKMRYDLLKQIEKDRRNLFLTSAEDED